MMSVSKIFSTRFKIDSITMRRSITVMNNGLRYRVHAVAKQLSVYKDKSFIGVFALPGLTPRDVVSLMNNIQNIFDKGVASNG
ncbi:hypothetical protein D3C79_1000700 [compost metagenome]